MAGADRLVEVARHGAHPVAPGTRAGPSVDVDTDDRGGRHLGHQVDSDGTRPGAQIRGPASPRQQPGGAPSELLGLDPGHIDARLHSDRVPAELQRPDDPRQRFSVLAPAQPPLEGGGVGGGGQQLAGFFAGRDAAGGREPLDDQRGDGIGERHVLPVWPAPILTNVMTEWCGRGLPGPEPRAHTRIMRRTTPSDTTLGGVVLSGVAKSFGPVRAVRGIDVAIVPGETVALLGPNGAGKSTTIDMILGLTRPDAGRVSVFGLSPSEAVKAGAVGGMLQIGSLIRDLSVRELIMMIGSLYPHPLPIDEVLALTGTADIAERRTNKLSGGQTQRVRFAIALVSDPDLLILDEPTVALDVEGRHEFWAAMRAFAARGKTVLFATHYLEEADAFADRIVLMAGGHVVADGPATEIKARAGRRTIRATLPAADPIRLGTLPGVVQAERHGEAVVLTCSDSDAALRALLGAYPLAADIEVRGAGLEEAFLELTGAAGGTDETEENR